VADAPNFASTLMSTAFQVGIASAAAIGGAAISAGWAYGQLPLLSSVAFGGGLLGTLALVTFHRRPKPALA
jgi:DHA1 family inner membrane transport protein